MIYFDTKNNLEFIQKFSLAFEQLREIEIQANENLEAKDTYWLSS